MKKSNSVRKKILNEFYKLAYDHGYKRTSMRQLSDACGMSKGHINFYFKKKEDLMIALCEKYHFAAETTISSCVNVPGDAILKFLLHQMMLCYFVSEKKNALRFLSEMSESSVFIVWRANALSVYLISMLTKENITVDKNNIFDACLVSISGIYAIMHRQHVKKIHLDYQKMFILFAKIIFACININNIDVYIENALRIFADFDKDILQSRFDSALQSAC